MTKQIKLFSKGMSLRWWILPVCILAAIWIAGSCFIICDLQQISQSPGSSSGGWCNSLFIKVFTVGGVLLAFLLCYFSFLLRAEVQTFWKEKIKRDENERLFLSVMHASDEAIVLIDDQGFVDCNKACAHMLGYPSREAFIQTERPATAPPTQPDGRSSIEKAHELEKEAFESGFQRFEWVNRRADGTDFPADIAITPVILRGKKMIYCVWRDITEARQIKAEKEELQAHMQQLQKMESIGRLAGGIAHDYNNMLGVILANVDILLEDLNADNPLGKPVKAIEQAAIRSAKLTEQLLAFARKQKTKPQSLDLNVACKEILEMLTPLIDHRIELLFNPNPHPVNVYIDPSQFNQLLTNLCVNARDAIADHGRITVAVDPENLSEAFCTVHSGVKPGSYVCLSVCDNGSGMDEQTQQHLFEPFYTTKPTGKGTGLGLATVYGIVKQNRGTITVTSKMGQGSNFKIYLPAGETAPLHNSSDAEQPDNE